METKWCHFVGIMLLQKLCITAPSLISSLLNKLLLTELLYESQGLKTIFVILIVNILARLRVDFTSFTQDIVLPNVYSFVLMVVLGIMAFFAEVLC